MYTRFRDLFYSKATEIFLDHKSWAPSSEYHFWFLRVIQLTSSQPRLRGESWIQIFDRQSQKARSILSWSVFRSNNPSRVRKISFSNGCRVCDELERERKKIRKGINGGIVDGLWIHLFFHRCWALATSFDLSKTSEILDAPSGPLIAFFSPSSVRMS